MNRNLREKGAGLPKRTQPSNKKFVVSIGRAAAGGVIFSLPLMMTMEMWSLGFYIEPFRRILMILSSIPLLIGLSHVFGFEETFGWQDDVIDAFVALAVGAGCAAGVLLLLGIIEGRTPSADIFGKIELQMIPASIGALLAQSQLGAKRNESDKDDRQSEEKATRYTGELFLMAVGSIFLSLSIAPTEEVILIAFSITKLQALQIAVVSILLMHAFVYLVDFRGTEKAPVPVSGWSVFFRLTVVGYAIAVLTALLVLWLFGRTNGLAPLEVAMITAVLGFPSAIGAAAARLIV